MSLFKFGFTKSKEGRSPEEESSSENTTSCSYSSDTNSVDSVSESDTESPLMPKSKLKSGIKRKKRKVFRHKHGKSKQKSQLLKTHETASSSTVPLSLPLPTSLLRYVIS